ncbi:MAG: hypothetical protein ONB48_01980 [candidate division KSB1 bacterium]|nr:hypothetical protein [candidate division KSB1 bacterium]MDZ7284425.1 hypothetical protein [candidate division KSB1 bacterium]MDZ7306682.1 hypothetical protein [candidate division KSB1 bacterium]MDZ7348046.1 hypothetical protein [candidate division KSB1 bacterium]MDZ7354508.1 hypothetical protein [candidate division KSB1 bacterium]
MRRWYHHPYRLGAEAYLQGGAMAATAGNAAAMLINPASLADLPDHLALFVETGWASGTDFFRFLNINIKAQYQPVQYAGVAWRPLSGLGLGLFYHRPTDYTLDFGAMHRGTLLQLAEAGEARALQSRQEDAIGVALATALSEHFHVGGSLQWRRATMTDEFAQARREGGDSAWRFAVGALWHYRGWQFGLATHSRYEAGGTVIIRPAGAYGGEFFRQEDPLTLRMGLSTPLLFQRLRLSAEAEFKDFEADIPIEKWQFYGGSTLRLSPRLEIGLGAFTFLKDYSAFVDGPESEIFLTGGVRLRLGDFRFTACWLEGDLLNQNFTGQRFVNLALGYALPGGRRLASHFNYGGN